MVNAVEVTILLIHVILLQKGSVIIMNQKNAMHGTLALILISIPFFLITILASTLVVTVVVVLAILIVIMIAIVTITKQKGTVYHHRQS
jgi:hypothetical protein